MFDSDVLVSQERSGKWRGLVRSPLMFFFCLTYSKGERLSPYVSALCLIMAVIVLFS